ncbi:MAG: hypothetical protein DRQ48_09300 [Gammaproteobacteria bacterium]|nr:MAG: hypothetical protein DRQ48_09300 [Gammaproteobacteria bacterium]
MFNSTVIYLPYDLVRIVDVPDNVPQGGSRTNVLGDILVQFLHTGNGDLSSVPEMKPFTVSGYPNPFNPKIKIDYYMPKRDRLTIKLYDLRGKLVNTLIDETVAAGAGVVFWDGKDRGGRDSASGSYIYIAENSREKIRRKVTLLR